MQIAKSFTVSVYSKLRYKVHDKNVASHN